MANNIGKISLDDIMAAASAGLDDAPAKTAEPVKVAEPVKAQEPVKVAEPVKAVTSTSAPAKKVGKVSLDDIMAAANAGLSAPQEKKTEPTPVVMATPVAVPVAEPVVEPVAAPIVEPVVVAPIVEPVMTATQVAEEPVITITEPVAAPEVTLAETTEETPEKEKKPSEFGKKMRKIALIDVFAKAIEKKQTGFVIWMVINLLIVTAVCLVTGPLAIILGPVIYAISLAIALSPLGEKILRSQNCIREIKSEKIKLKLQPIFDKVYAEARAKEPGISSKVKLYISEDECPNAYALGHDTVCVTRGLLDMNMSDDQIAALLGHEFGHLAHKDTEDILVITVGNLFVVLILQFFALIFRMFGAIISIFDFFSGTKEEESDSVIARALVYFLTVVVVGAWTKLGAMICKRSNHDAEFAADRFSAELGYAKALSDAFLVIDGGPPAKGLLATLTSSHPNTAERVMRLKEYQYGV